MQWIEHRPGINTPPVGSLVWVVAEGRDGERPPEVARVTALGRAIGSWVMRGTDGPWPRVVRFALIRPHSETKALTHTMKAAEMTPKQRTLARHALGLPNMSGVSYRNRYVAPYQPGGPVNHWFAMCDAGLAECAPVNHRGLRRFWLTPEGARAALESGEALCPEDFPIHTKEPK